jgi:hypothetical protein
MLLLIYLHGGDLSLSELLLILLTYFAVLAFPILLICIFIWVIARPKDKVQSINIIIPERDVNE